MAFEGLSEKLQETFKHLKGKGVVSEKDIDAAMREVRLALLEADVNFKVVKKFVAEVKEKALGAEVMKSLTPGQQVVKIVKDQMVELMGGTNSRLTYSSSGFTIYMLVGLQGTGKTTTCGKLASWLKQNGKKPMLCACDVYRPAAAKQLLVNGEKQEVEVFSIEDNKDPVDIAKKSLQYAEKNGHNVIILDTAGRLQIDDEMMDELVAIKREANVHQTILVVDAMTGQEAVNVAKSFDEKISIDGVILSKLDGDARGGAALSVKAVTGKPILYVGMGEKLSDLEQFYPDRMASRILGMGDVLTLIEKASKSIDEEKEKQLTDKLKKGKFDFEDYLESMNQMKNMGGISSILSMMPGLSGMGMGNVKTSDIESAVSEEKLKRTEAIILSMTKKERQNPDILNPQRKHRIAKGAGVDIAEVNRLVKQFEQSRKMMKQIPGLMGKGKRHGGFKFPF